MRAHLSNGATRALGGMPDMTSMIAMLFLVIVLIVAKIFTIAAKITEGGPATIRED